MKRERRYSAAPGALKACLLAAALSAFLACSGAERGAGNGNAGNSNASQPQPSPAAAKQPAGLIEIASTPPGATIILIDTGSGGAGEPRVKGATPATVTVEPGTYTITLEKAGYRPFQKEVKVEADKTVKVTAPLRKG